MAKSLRWSARLRNTGIEIKGASITYIAPPIRKNHYGFLGISALTDSIGEGTNSGKSKWRVRINRLEKGMYVGICQTRYAQQHQFERWGWTNIGHGHYCIRSTGFAASHYDVNVNSKRMPFNFRAGDVLQFEYDSINGKLTVANNKNEKFEMDIEKDTT